MTTIVLYILVFILENDDMFKVSTEQHLLRQKFGLLPFFSFHYIQLYIQSTPPLSAQCLLTQAPTKTVVFSL